MKSQFFLGSYPLRKKKKKNSKNCVKSLFLDRTFLCRDSVWV